MPTLTGYSAGRRMRGRPQDRRIAHRLSAPDGLDRNGSTLAVHMDEFLSWLQVRQYSPHTIEDRRKDLCAFFLWAQDRDLRLPAAITRSILESYQRQLWRHRKTDGSPLGVGTQRKIVTDLRLFFSWLCRQHVLEANPAADLILPRPHKALPDDALGLAEVEALLAVPNIADLLGLRDRAILELFYSSGLRRTEMARLQLGDLSRERRTLFIHKGKGAKDRVVPVGQRAMSWLVKYLDDARPLLVIDEREQALFVTSYGDAFHPNSMGNLVTHYLRLANPKRAKGSCHLLRHTCATHMLEGGADIRYIQQLLGHEKLDTTAIYTRVSIKQLQAVHAHTHPAERENKPKEIPPP